MLIAARPSETVALVRPERLCTKGKQATAAMAKSQLVYTSLGFSTASCLAQQMTCVQHLGLLTGMSMTAVAGLIQT